MSPNGYLFESLSYILNNISEKYAISLAPNLWPTDLWLQKTRQAKWESHDHLQVHFFVAGYIMMTGQSTQVTHGHLQVHLSVAGYLLTTKPRETSSVGEFVENTNISL